MEDGLYQVTWKGVCAGFVVEDGLITLIAPVLDEHPGLLDHGVRIEEGGND